MAKCTSVACCCRARPKPMKFSSTGGPLPSAALTAPKRRVDASGPKAEASTHRPAGSMIWNSTSRASTTWPAWMPPLAMMPSAGARRVSVAPRFCISMTRRRRRPSSSTSMSTTWTRMPAPVAARVRARLSRVSALAISWSISPRRSAMVVRSAAGSGGSIRARTSPRRTTWPSRGRPPSGGTTRPPPVLWTRPPRLGSLTTRPIRLMARPAGCTSAATVRMSSSRWVGLARKTLPSGRRRGVSERLAGAAAAAGPWSCPGDAWAGCSAVPSNSRTTPAARRRSRPQAQPRSSATMPVPAMPISARSISRGRWRKAVRADAAPAPPLATSGPRVSVPMSRSGAAPPMVMRTSISPPEGRPSRVAR